MRRTLDATSHPHRLILTLAPFLQLSTTTMSAPAPATAQPTVFKVQMAKLVKTVSKATDAAQKGVARAKSSSFGGKKHAFRFTAPADTEVSVAGTFSNWEPVPMKFDAKTSTFVYKVALLPGQTVEYKFVVSGKWVVDESAPSTWNGANQNNVLTF